MIDFDTYIKMGEPGGKERAEAWKTAIGLQAVDGLKTSEYLNETAAKHIEGDITIEEVKELIDTYYLSKTARTPEDDEKEEADKAAANITKIINEPSFTFSLHGLTSIHNHNFSVSFPIRWSIPPSFVFIFKLLGNSLSFHIKPGTRLSINVYVEKHPAILIGIVLHI